MSAAGLARARRRDDVVLCWPATALTGAGCDDIVTAEMKRVLPSESSDASASVQTFDVLELFPWNGLSFRSPRSQRICRTGRSQRLTALRPRFWSGRSSLATRSRNGVERRTAVGGPR